MMSIKLLAALTIVALIVAFPARADFDDGVNAYEQGDFQTAFEKWLPLAEQDNTGAQYMIGVLYATGRGVPQNYLEAANWYRIAAERGAALAQLQLGAMYSDGLGVVQDYAESAKWLRLAAEQGNADAQHLLGLQYANGSGVQKNLTKAYMWLSISMAQENPSSASQSVESARMNIDMLAELMSSSEIEEAQRRASEWLETHESASN